MMKHQNIGGKIRQISRERNLSAQVLAMKISTCRANIYNIFKRDTIDIEMLVKLSKVLKTNLIKEYSNEIDQWIEEQKQIWPNLH